MKRGEKRYIWQADDWPHWRYDLADPEDKSTWRRGVYRFIFRSQTQPFMTCLDCADPSMRVEKRNESMSAIQALDGPAEAEMVAHLLRLRDSLGERQAASERAADLSGVQQAALGAVNTYFERALRAVPEIDAYLREIAAREH